MLKLEKCPICNSEDIKPFFEWKEELGKVWGVYECNECTLAFTNPQPTWEELKEYYDRNYKPYHPATDQQFDSLFDVVKSTGMYDGIKLNPNDRVLEVGPGGGTFLSLAGKYCKEAIGVEPSDAAVEVLRSKGCNIFHGTIDDFQKSYASERFTLVYLSHVLEHLPQPIAAIRSISKVLSSTGKIIIRVPNAGSWAFRNVRGNWMGTDLPRHLMHYSHNSIAALANKSNLEVVYELYESPPGIVQQAIVAFLNKRIKIPNKLIWLLPSINWAICKMVARKLVTPQTSMNIEVHLQIEKSHSPNL